jgi:hypothetical protein
MKMEVILFRRVVLIGLGLQTIVASIMGMVGAVAQVRAWRDDPLVGASLVLFLLTMLLAIVGGWLVLRGMKYERDAF